MISNYLEVLVLSIVQGVSEFIPVSSSAHLIIFSNIISFSNKSLIFDVGLHLGSLLAIIFYFKKELLNISNDKKLFNLLLIGSIPLILVGYIFYSTDIINSFRNLKVIAWTTLIFGILMYFADTFKIKKNIEKDLTIKNILIIGILQILAIIPGVSRAGITITAGKFCCICVITLSGRNCSSFPEIMFPNLIIVSLTFSIKFCIYRFFLLDALPILYLPPRALYVFTNHPFAYALG